MAANTVIFVSHNTTLFAVTGSASDSLIMTTASASTISRMQHSRSPVQVQYTDLLQE